MAADPATIVQGLDDTSKKNEQEIVIEFATDRILHYVGVYLTAFIAVIAKISELAASTITCYPAGNVSVSGDFIKYANSYCWESSNVMTQSNTSHGGDDHEAIFIDHPGTFMTIFRALPYVMLLEAVLYALPSIFWHGFVGARLMGHLKFMRNMLTDIYEAVKKVPTAVYEGSEAYDKKSYYLNGWNGFDPDYVGQQQQPQQQPQQQQQGNEAAADESTNLLAMGEDSRSLVFGDMLDRHLFSMLCFENFSSLEHHPYILSVYRLTGIPPESPDDAFTGSMMKGMLRLQCQGGNFGGKFLVKAYFCRHAIGATVSLIVVLSMAAILSWIDGEGWQADSYRCDIPFHDDVYMTCTILRRLDMIAYLIVNLAISLMYCLLSMARIVFIRMSNKRAICHYFEEINDTGSIALDAAAVKTDGKRKLMT